MKRSMLAQLAIVALAIVYAVPAQAHTELSSSTPADDTSLQIAPKEVEFTFSAAVRLTAVSLISDEAEQRLEIESSEAAEQFVVGLPELGPGEYTVRWRAVSADTHVIAGEIRFRVVT